MRARRRAVFLLLAAVLLGGCKSKEVRALEALCPTVEKLVCEEPVTEFTNPEDRLTIVAGQLGEEFPVFQELFKPVAPLPRDERLAASKAIIEKTLGRPWACPTWDALWSGQDACAVARRR